MRQRRTNLLQQTVSEDKPYALTIKDPFTFEFLGLNVRDTVSESDLEQALIYIECVRK